MRERERERSTRHLYGGAALQLFVSIRHAGFISAVSACTKTLFFTTGPAGNMARLRCIHVDGPCIDSDCNCCVSLQITASRPSAPQPSPHHAIPSPLRPCSRALPFLCIVHGKYGPRDNWSVCVPRCNWYTCMYIQWTPTNFRFWPSFPSIFFLLLSFVFKREFCEYISRIWENRIEVK